MAELFHFVAAAVELPVPRACATACKLAQLHALSRLCQYRPAGPPKMHAQNDTKMHSDECKGRSLRFCVRAKQRVRFCVRAEQRVATIVGFRTLSSANVCSTNAFSFLCSPGWGLGEGLVRERVRDLRRKKKKKNGNEHHANSTAVLPSSVFFCKQPTGQGQGSTSGSASESLHTLYTAIAVNILPSKPIKTIHKSRSFHTYRRASRCTAKDVPHLEGD